MKNPKDTNLVRNVIEEALQDIGARNCRVTIREDKFRRNFIEIKYVDPRTKDEIHLDNYSLDGTRIFTDGDWSLDLNQPGSVEMLKSCLGFDYDLYTRKRWKALTLLPWTFTKFFWRIRKVALVEGREWLNGRFVKPPRQKSKS